MDESEKKAPDYFAHLFAGVPIADGGPEASKQMVLVVEFLNFFNSLAVIHILKFLKEKEGEEVVDNLVEAWSKLLEGRISDELERHEEMMKTDIGQIMGGLVPSAAEFHMNFDEAQIKAEEILRTLLDVKKNESE